MSETEINDTDDIDLLQEMTTAELSNACAQYLAKGFFQEFCKAKEQKRVEDMTTEELIECLEDSRYTTYGDSPLCDDELFIALKARTLQAQELCGYFDTALTALRQYHPRRYLKQ